MKTKQHSKDLNKHYRFTLGKVCIFPEVITGELIICSMLYDNQIDFVTPPGYDSFRHFLNVTDVFQGLHIMNVPLMGLTPSISNITSSLWFSQSSCITVLFVCMQRAANLITILNSIFFLTSQILKHLFYQCIFENMSFLYLCQNYICFLNVKNTDEHQ